MNAYLSSLTAMQVGRFYGTFSDTRRLTIAIAIAFVRSKSIYETPSVSREESRKRVWPCSIDLYAATGNTIFRHDEFSSDPSELSHNIVQFYARLLILRCYEDYNLRHDVQPINELLSSDGVATKGRPHIEAIHRRRLELVKMKQDLSGYLGPSARGQQRFAVHDSSDSTETPCVQRLRGLLTDIEMLLSLYDYNMRVEYTNGINRKPV